MKITLDVDIGHNRISGRLRNGRALLDDVAMVVVEPVGNRRSPIDRLCGNTSGLMITGIGSIMELAGPDARRRPVLVPDDPQPELAAAIANYVALKSWSDMRHGWRQLLAPLDRLKVWITVAGYESFDADTQRRFAKALPYHPQIDWWVYGDKVTF